MNMTLSDITRIFGFALDPEKDAPATGVSTDSRTIRNGMVFFALKGPRFDGRRFVAAAFEKARSGRSWRPADPGKTPRPGRRS